MPTTSNFGWTTPADTDLVKDGAAAIRTLGNGIDTSLVDLKGGTTGQVLSKASNTDLDFTWVAQDDSNAIQNALLTTTGDTIYASSASTPARLGIGTTGQVLTVSGGVPVWSTPAAGGKVLQVVHADTTTDTTVASTTPTDTTLSATITPTSATSKILVIVAQNAGVQSASQNSYSQMRLMRGATEIWASGTEMLTSDGGTTAGGSNNVVTMQSIVYLDSPSTTSATTYKTQGYVNSTANSNAFRAQRTSSRSNIILMEIGA